MSRSLMKHSKYYVISNKYTALVCDMIQGL
nr:MAG TPA: hypothetical protein [Caudoviricetes sp.]